MIKKEREIKKSCGFSVWWRRSLSRQRATAFLHSFDLNIKYLAGGINSTQRCEAMHSASFHVQILRKLEEKVNNFRVGDNFYWYPHPLIYSFSPRQLDFRFPQFLEISPHEVQETQKMQKNQNREAGGVT